MVKRLMLYQYQWGFCFVDGVPIDPEKTKELIERIAFIRHTHYGIVHQAPYTAILLTGIHRWLLGFHSRFELQGHSIHERVPWGTHG